MKKITALSVGLLLCSFLFACVTASLHSSPSRLILAADERPASDHVEARGSHYAISTQGIFATEAAHEVLREGGNLMDAAIAASFTLAVERPQSTGLTGGGFMLYREASSGQIYAIDFRERAPLRATEKMFLDAQGKPDPRLSQDSILSSGVPGLVAGLVEIHQRFGKLPLAEVIKPAIALAESGFVVYPELADALADRAELLLKQPAARAIFAGKDGKVLKLGERVVQKDLAQTLRQIAGKGRAGFYQGPVARKFLTYFRRKKGLITAKDLAAYQVKWRAPVHGSFHGYDIYSMPPPSSGGVHVIQFLQFLEKDPLQADGFLSSRAIHLAASALQSAFADRARYLGDPDFVKVPVSGLLSKAYAFQRRSEVSLGKARHDSEVMAGNPLPFESQETTHFSMMDSEGNMISSTQTINGWMGSGLIVPGTGLVLNNEMDDFSAQAGDMNMYGAVGSNTNSIKPQKTPLSSMSPTLVLQSGKPVMSVGAPGGTRIISCVAQTLLNVLEFKLPLYESIASIRYHHQWRPDVLEIDPPGPAPEVLQQLKDMTYDVQIKPLGCKVMAVSQEGKILHAVSDPRDIGTSLAE